MFEAVFLNPGMIAIMCCTEVVLFSLVAVALISLEAKIKRLERLLSPAPRPAP